MKPPARRKGNPMKKAANSLLGWLQRESGWPCCEVDGRNGTGHNGLQIHHIIIRSQGGLDELHNIILLCRSCHDTAHGKGPKGWPVTSPERMTEIITERNQRAGFE